MPPASADVLDPKPSDGGWGWMVVFGAHISIGFAYSTPKASSIFFKPIQEDLGASYSEIAWISSIMSAVMYAGGPVSSMLVKRFGSRPVVMTGGSMCGVSMVTASFGSSIVYLYLCIGIVGESPITAVAWELSPSYEAHYSAKGSYEALIVPASG